MTRGKYQVLGLSEMQRNLKEIPKAMGNNAQRRALVDAAEPMARKMRANAPKDQGDLEESVDVQTRRPRGVDKMVGVEVFVGPSDFTGSLQEFGTPHHPPQPFARPAFEEEAVPTIRRLHVNLIDNLTRALDRFRARQKAGKK